MTGIISATEKLRQKGEYKTALGKYFVCESCMLGKYFVCEPCMFAFSCTLFTKN